MHKNSVINIFKNITVLTNVLKHWFDKEHLKQAKYVRITSYVQKRFEIYRLKDNLYRKKVYNFQSLTFLF